MAKMKITQIRSRIGATATQKKNLDATPIILGMVEKVKHLVKVEEVK